MHWDLIRSLPARSASGLPRPCRGLPGRSILEFARDDATASPDQSDRERVLIKLPFAGLNRCDNYQHGVQHPQRYQDWNPDQEDAKNRGDRVVYQHRNLKIQRFLPVRVDLRRVAAFYQPYDKRTQDVTQEVKEQSEQCGSVAQDAPRSNIRGSGWSRRRLWIHTEPFAQGQPARQ